MTNIHVDLKNVVRAMQHANDGGSSWAQHKLRHIDADASLHAVEVGRSNGSSSQTAYWYFGPGTSPTSHSADNNLLLLHSQTEMNI